VPAVSDKYFSREVGAWLIAQVQACPEEFAEYREVSELLKKMLAEHPGSLATPIHAYLYPRLSAPELIAKEVINNPLIFSMLNPNQALEEVTPKLINYLRHHLQKNPSLQHEKQLRLLHEKFPAVMKNIAKTKPVNLESAINHHDLDLWFNYFETCRKSIWIKIVESLYGQLTWDGEFILPYCYDIGELISLTDGYLQLNSQNLMELDVSKMDSYKYRYAVDCKRHDAFEKDIRHAFGLLGLHFLPNQNFHERIIFTPESTRILMDYGMHYSRDYCAQLIQAKEHHRFFQRLESNRKDLPTLPADIKAAIIKYTCPNIHHRDEVLTRPTHKKA